MHFTREPIIETVITPREGCKLVVRCSKVSGQEEYHVEAVEVVSFGHSFFFRSLEKPKSFLVPVSDYEILELRETRLVLKNAPADRSIKIGGGRDASIRPPRERELQPEEPRSQPEESTEAGQSSFSDSSSSQDRRNGGRRGRRGRRNRDRNQDHQPHREPHSHEVSPAPIPSIEGSEMIDEGAALPEEPKAPSFISKLFPPPQTLIKETLGRYKHPAEPLEDPSAQQAAPSFEHDPEEQGDELSEE